jgi:hypothetical protein
MKIISTEIKSPTTCVIAQPVDWLLPPTLLLWIADCRVFLMKPNPNYYLRYYLLIDFVNSNEMIFSENKKSTSSTATNPSRLAIDVLVERDVRSLKYSFSSM